MASPESLEALRKTRETLKEIKKQLRPFLRDLVGENNTEDDEIDEKVRTAKASMAVALSMGTLRMMGARIRGLDQGKKPDDPLRKELNNMRKLMRDLQKKLDDSKDKQGPAKRKADEKSEKKKTPSSQKASSEEPVTKRRRAS